MAPLVVINIQELDKSSGTKPLFAKTAGLTESQLNWKYCWTILICLSMEKTLNYYDS